MIMSKATARGVRGEAASVGVNDFGAERATLRPLSKSLWFPSPVVGAGVLGTVLVEVAASGSGCCAAPETGPVPQAAESSNAQPAAASLTLFTCVATFRRGAWFVASPR
jgi:hypothetical protein